MATNEPSAPCARPLDSTERRPGTSGVLPRIQAFEFCDQAWLQGCWRDAYLDALNFVFRVTRVYRRMHEPFARWARTAGHPFVLDLASGGGGPMGTLAASARRDNVAFPRLILSDLFPNRTALERMKRDFPGQIDFVAEPLDATDPGRMQAPLLSICTGFHHFPPSQARRILRRAVRAADGIFVMEGFPRSWWSLPLPLATLPLLILAPLFSRRFSWKKWVIGSIVPIVPLMIVFDGTVSVLRVYRFEEIQAMLPDEAKRGWRWEQGSQRYLGFFRNSYWFGLRIRKNAAARPEAPPENRIAERRDMALQAS